MEKWKVIKYKGRTLKVSDHGNVINMDYHKTGKERIATTSINNCGYVQTLNGLVHRLVAQAFLGPIPKNYTVNHIDGNKLNNHVSNLEIVTRSRNLLHAFEIGLKSGKVISESNKGISRNKGIPKSEEHRKKMKESQKLRWIIKFRKELFPDWNENEWRKNHGNNQ
ncbi:HNH endonuclease signature motif containing protein [Cytobacillus gottheilii]|uniref:HNH endonuclease signature motif containing protein n=1 Tax=Cytobacillus gottheilii TaxID=859144 RepID=UPI000829BDD3|nr:HNH endonuclease signature motif containing protein [Cytobacillus gottheilii]